MKPLKLMKPGSGILCPVVLYRNAQILRPDEGKTRLEIVPRIGMDGTATRGIPGTGIGLVQYR